MPIPCQKHLFRLDPEAHYLNGAYMSPMLQSVEAAGTNGLLRKRQPNHISPQDFFDETEVLRALFATLVGAKSPEDVALIPSVSYGMAILAANLPAAPGQKIIVAGDQFPSNVYPWQRLAASKGLHLQVIPMPEQTQDRSEAWTRAILDAIDEHTALVSLPQVHWASGTVFDLAAISDQVHHFGGLLVADGTQSVGAYPMDVQALGLDALVCAGYKWLMGPYGLGYAWFGPAFLDGQPIEDNWINRANSEDFSRLVDYQPAYQPGARRYDVGERSNFILVPMGIAALRQLLDWGPENIQAYCQVLSSAAIVQWQHHGYELEPETRRAHHLFGLQLPKHVSQTSLQQQLRDRNIVVSLRGTFLRIAPNVYNDKADMDALTEVLLNC